MYFAVLGLYFSSTSGVYHIIYRKQILANLIARVSLLNYLGYTLNEKIILYFQKFYLINLNLSKKALSHYHSENNLPIPGEWVGLSEWKLNQIGN